jgi:hypothetical protein
MVSDNDGERETQKHQSGDKSAADDTARQNAVPVQIMLHEGIPFSRAGKPGR